MKDVESQLEESQAMVKMLSIPPPDVPGADRHELLRLLDRRQHEIDQLSQEWKNLSGKLASVASEKSEFQTRLSSCASVCVCACICMRIVFCVSILEINCCC